jgi:hypothetical protein
MAQKKSTKIEIGGQKFDVGNKVGYGEFEKIAAATGRPLSDLKETILNKGGSLNTSGKNYYNQNVNTVNQTGAGSGPGSGSGTAATGIQVTNAEFPWDKYANLQIELGGIQAGAATESERIRGLSNQEIAKINAAASNYGYDRQLEGTKYAADSEERWRQAVATIEGDKKASLQNIINAGLKDVAEIEGSYSLKNVEAKGKYDTQIMGLRTQADKDIAKMDANQKMYNLLGLAFG